ncbi:MAG TPA: hypothetical protein VGN06_05795, partial [Gaiellaceae bacterium]
AFQQLASVAAGWIDYAVRKDEGLRFDFVASPRSIAYFRAGMYLQSLAIGGDDTAALKAYAQAIEEDGTNVGALINLGRAWDGDGKHDEAELLLKRALAAIAAEPRERTKPDEPYEAPVRFNPIWYQAMYSLAAFYANKFERSKQEEQLDENAQVCVVLYSEAIIAMATETLRKRKLGRDRELAKQLKTTVVPGVQAMLAGVTPGSEGLVAALAARTDLTYRARFNIVCYYAVQGNFPEALRQFACAIEHEPFPPPQTERRLLAVFAWKDPWLKDLRRDAGSLSELKRLTAPYISP